MADKSHRALDFVPKGQIKLSRLYSSKINIKMNSGIHSIHYKGPSSVSQSPKVRPDEIKSMRSIPLTTGSYTFGDMAPYIVNGKAITRTSGNVFEDSVENYKALGQVTQFDDYGFRGWKAAGEEFKPVDFNVIPKMPDFGMVHGSSLRMHYPDKRDTPASNYVHPEILAAVDPNNVGRYASLIGNLQSLMQSMVDETQYRDETASYVEFAAHKHGLHYDKSKTLGITGIGVVNTPAIAYYNFETGHLVSAEDFETKARLIAARHGIDESEFVKGFKRFFIDHENFHVFLDIHGKAKDEALQGRIQKEFGALMAERYKGEPIERMYRALSDDGAEYEASYLRKGFYRKTRKQLYGQLQDLTESIIHKFVHEGIELGYEGEMLEAYVNARAENTFKGFNTGVRSRLEEIVSMAKKGNKSESNGRYIKHSEGKNKTYERHDKKEAEYHNDVQQEAEIAERDEGSKSDESPEKSEKAQSESSD